MKGKTTGNYLYYKGYAGSIEFSAEDTVFHGKVDGIESLITFEGDSVTAIIEDFHEAVDEYLAFCENNGIQPEKPFNGSVNVRIGIDLHKKAAMAASSKGISLNAFVKDAISQSIAQS